jgi:NAD(P)-dependent dehydrogenase (short-subunit alcohol dehydrogenase family)
MRLDGKVAIITGASRGIGRHMAVEFAKAGARVVAGARRAAPLEELAGEIRAAGGEALSIPTDVARAEDCRNLVTRAADAFGTVDILVNNAAISGPSKLVKDLDPAEWEETLRVNLTSTYLMCHFAVPYMMEQRSGRILNISSFNGKKAVAMRVSYAASKMGMVGLTHCLAQELGPYNVTVNAISPGPVEGERVDEVIALMSRSQGIPEDTYRQQLRSMSPLNTMVNAEDVTRVALFLASDYGRHMTGQDINVTAGVVMH